MVRSQIEIIVARVTVNTVSLAYSLDALNR